MEFGDISFFGAVNLPFISFINLGKSLNIRLFMSQFTIGLNAE